MAASVPANVVISALSKHPKPIKLHDLFPLLKPKPQSPQQILSMLTAHFPPEDSPHGSA